MSDIDDDSEIYFSVKFLGRIQVVRPGGMQILTDAVQALQDPNTEMDEKMKKTKVHLFLTRSAIDILEHKTKFMLYSCALPSVSFCAVHPTRPKILGFVARHPAADMYHCYIFQSKKFVSSGNPRIRRKCTRSLKKHLVLCESSRWHATPSCINLT
uniref:PID domain-containing protein n=1 Tax=Cyprinus carpio TaxID=7962 RepID=A0A8C1I9L2_CYPCA